MILPSLGDRFTSFFRAGLTLAGCGNHFRGCVAARRGVVALAALFVFTFPLSAETASKARGVIVVFDGSGSMWGNTAANRVSKLFAARDGVKQILARLPPEVRTGLLAFGHRRRADCTDTALAVPPEPGSAVAAAAALEKIVPKGKGPLARALSEAALAADSSIKTIVVLYDGPDNCGGDVCGTAAAISSTHPGLRITAIGLNLEPGVAARTSCIASLTGGAAFDVSTPAALSEALETTFVNAGLLSSAPGADGEKEEVPRPEAVAPGVAQTSGPSRIRVQAFLGPHPTPMAAPVRWSVRPAGGGEPMLEMESPELAAPLPPGTYEIRAERSLASAETQITVGPKGLTTGRVTFAAGVVELNMGPAGGGGSLGNMLDNMHVSVVPLAAATGGGEAAPARPWAGGRTDALVLPAGRYQVSVVQGLFHEEWKVSLAAGEVRTLEVAPPTGRLILGAAERPQGPRIEQALFIVEKDDPSAPDGRREVARSAAAAPAFALPPGTYYITVRVGAAEAHELAAVGSGAATEKIVVLPLTRLSISVNLKAPEASRGSTPVWSRIVRHIEQNEVEVAHVAGKMREFILPPGRYRVEAGAGGHNVFASENLELSAGSRKDLVLSLEGAKLSLRLGGGTGRLLDPFWEVTDATGKIIWRTSQSEPEGLLSPGRYHIRFASREQNYEMDAALAAGEQKTVEAGPQ